MDIEKLIERLNELYRSLRLDGEQQCSPEINTVAFGLMDAATALSTLQAENEKMQEELARVTAERDAAIKSIPHDCKTCAYHTVFFNGCTPDHDCTNPDGGCSNNYDRWKWRGT